MVAKDRRWSLSPLTWAPLARPFADFSFHRASPVHFSFPRLLSLHRSTGARFRLNTGFYSMIVVTSPPYLFFSHPTSDLRQTKRSQSPPFEAPYRSHSGFFAPARFSRVFLPIRETLSTPGRRPSSLGPDQTRLYLDIVRSSEIFPSLSGREMFPPHPFFFPESGKHY